MDPETIGRFGGWIGGIVGGGMGVLGGLSGTYCTIKNTRGPQERAFAIKVSIIGWMLVLAFVSAMLLIPTWHKHLLWMPYAVLRIWGIRAWNKTQLRIRNDESTDAA